MGMQGVTTVHCEVAREVANAYRDLHLFSTQVNPEMTFYSGAAGGPYQVNRRSAADSILAQAVEGIDFPKVIEAAPFVLGKDELLTLRVFVDKSVVEVFVNDRQAIARRIYPTRPDSRGVTLFAHGGEVKVPLIEAWDMMPSNPY